MLSLSTRIAPGSSRPDSTGFLADLIPNGESVVPDRFLLGHVHGSYLGLGRTLLAPRQQLSHLVGASFEDRLDAVIWKIADPTGDTGGPGILRALLPEEHALHPARDPDVPS